MAGVGFAHPEIQRPLQDRDVFVDGMPVRRNDASEARILMTNGSPTASGLP
jgi:hypothetical protein